MTTASRGTPLYESTLLERQGVTAAEEHDWTRSQQLLLAALEKRKASGETSDPGIGLTLDKLGASYLGAKMLDKALGCFEEAEQVLQNFYYAGHASLASVLEHKADTLVEQKKYSDAEPVLKRALDIHEKTLAGDHRSVLECLRKLSFIYRHLGKPAEAAALLTKALKPLDASPLGPTEEFRYELALIYLNDDKAEQAAKELEQAIKGFKQRYNFARLADCFQALGQALVKAGRTTEAGAAVLNATKYGLMSGPSESPVNLYPSTFLR